MQKRKNKTLLLLISLVMAACSQDQKEPSLPILNHSDLKVTEVDGKQIIDTVYQTVPDFSFTNQDGEIVTQEQFKGNIQVADFFFTSCSSICIDMTENMKYLQEQTKDIKELKIISFSIDPTRDSIETLKRYVEKKKINTSNWDLVMGPKEEIYELAVEGYVAVAQEDDQAPEGYLHSGHFILVDKNGYIRGVYTGSDVNKRGEIDQLIEDISKLLKE